MSEKRDFHQVLTLLTYARASNTLRFILEEAQRIEQAAGEAHASRIVQCVFHMGVLADMLCDPSVMMLAHGPDGTILNLSETQAAALGKPKAALLDTCIWSHFPPDVAHSRRSLAEAALATGRPSHVMDRSCMSGRTLEAVVVPMSCGRVLVLNRPASRGRVFEQAFSNRQRIIE